MSVLLKITPGLSDGLHNAPVSLAWHREQKISPKRCVRIAERLIGDLQFDRPVYCDLLLYFPSKL